MPTLRIRTTSLLGSVLAFVVLFPTLVSPATPAANKLDDVAKCLTQKGAVMYGAFWCEHCKEQKELFGSSFQNVKYVECSVVGAPRQQTEICKNLAIKRYPTWIFADNERREGVVQLQSLAEKTGCKLP